MKTKLLLLIFVSTTFFAFAQNSLELTIGPSLTNVSLKGVDNDIRPSRNLHAGIQANALWNQTIDENWSFLAGFTYKEKGFVINESLNTDILDIPIKLGVSANTTINYVEIPLHLKYKIGKNDGIKAYAFAGPSVGYAISGNIRTRANMLFDVNINKTDLDLSDKIYNRYEFSANAGIGVEIPVGNGAIVANGNYMHGFSRAIDNTVVDFKARNYGLGASIGYKFNF